MTYCSQLYCDILYLYIGEKEWNIELFFVIDYDIDCYMKYDNGYNVVIKSVFYTVYTILNIMCDIID